MDDYETLKTKYEEFVRWGDFKLMYVAEQCGVDSVAFRCAKERIQAERLLIAIPLAQARPLEPIVLPVSPAFHGVG